MGCHVTHRRVAAISRYSLHDMIVRKLFEVVRDCDFATVHTPEMMSASAAPTGQSRPRTFVPCKSSLLHIVLMTFSFKKHNLELLSSWHPRNDNYLQTRLPLYKTKVHVDWDTNSKF